MRVMGLALLVGACGGGPAPVPAAPRAVVVEPARETRGSEAESAADVPPKDPQESRPEACRTVGSEGSIRNAKALFQQGNEHYLHAEFAAAESMFRTAYELTCSVPLLFDIGRCQEQLGDFAGAIQAYEGFLSRSQWWDSERLKLHIEELRRRE